MSEDNDFLVSTFDRRARVQAVVVSWSGDRETLRGTFETTCPSCKALARYVQFAGVAEDGQLSVTCWCDRCRQESPLRRLA